MPAHVAEQEQQRPVSVYLITTPGCQFCAKAKADQLPKLRAAGAVVVVLTDAVEAHQIAGFHAKAYPCWVFTSGGVKVSHVEGLAPARALIDEWQRLRLG